MRVTRLRGPIQAYLKPFQMNSITSTVSHVGRPWSMRVV